MDNATIIEIALKILPVFITVLVCIVVHLLQKDDGDEELLEAQARLLESEQDVRKLSVKGLGEFLKSRNKYKYNKTQIYLSKIGLNYMLKRTVYPEEYLLAKIFASIGLAIAGMSLYGFYGLLVGMVVGYLAIPVILKMSNDRDNDAFITDIQSVYETLKIRTESGVFFTSSVQQCYRVVENPRLKEALATLGSELAATNNLKQSVDAFQMKFKNRYVDKLCVTIRQGYESGSTVNCLNDILNNINGMQKAMETSRKNKLDSEIMVTQALILSAILVTIFYTIVTVMMSSTFV